MRYSPILLAALLLGGCANTQAVWYPKTGETVACSEGAMDASPWSQSEACVADHIAHGWVPVGDR